MRQEGQRGNIGLSQYFVLRYLCTRDECTTVAIGEALFERMTGGFIDSRQERSEAIKTHWASGVVRGLRDRGLVQYRNNGHNLSIRYYRPTEAGRDLIRMWE